MSSQTLAPPVPAYTYPVGFPREFVNFHDTHGWILESLICHALQLKAAGRREISARYLIEHLRIHPETWEEADSIGGLDNNFICWYSRLIWAEEPGLRGIITMRRTSEEMALPDPNQTTLELFDDTIG